ncbi:hypothetical protein HK097_002960 [Rhizophlyctis rosea]|uniref:non-specific serine/threonine protein kinase n=1 Tax=Rhizophlyctis rosea TaxID=64517 RepID=A0AAD5WZV5_9FUNG|nr:hypothetical protein HK097_002960 [Rhizophlyctis rosea]
MADTPPSHSSSEAPQPVGFGETIGVYKVDKTIGQGTYGKVRLGINTHTNEKVAIKVIEKSQIQSSKQVARLQREIRFLKLLHHPHIVKVYEVIETTDFIYIIMEYAAGGELFDYIVACKRVKEEEARKFFRMVLSAVDYCHKNAVIHRDLKPENLLLDEHKVIKIIDFGFGNNFRSEELLDTFCGSPFYAAPEMILGKKYEGPEVDMWSLGVILFALLCGHLPFDDDNMKELYKKIASGDYQCPDYLMPDARNLISRLITVDPKERAKLPEVLKHEWVMKGYNGLQVHNYLPTRHHLNRNDLSKEIVSRLCAFGYKMEDIDHAFSEQDQSKPDPVRATYWLLKEMLQREQSRVQMERRKSFGGVLARGGAGGSLPTLSKDGGVDEQRLNPRSQFQSETSVKAEGGEDTRSSRGSLDGKEGQSAKRDYGNLQQGRRQSTPDHAYRAGGQPNNGGGSGLGPNGSSIASPPIAKLRNQPQHEGAPLQQLNRNESSELGGRPSVFGRPQSLEEGLNTPKTLSRNTPSPVSPTQPTQKESTRRFSVPNALGFGSHSHLLPRQSQKTQPRSVSSAHPPPNQTNVRRGSFAAPASPTGTGTTSKIKDGLRHIGDQVQDMLFNVTGESVKKPAQIREEVERVLNRNQVTHEWDDESQNFFCETDAARFPGNGNNPVAAAAEQHQFQFQQQPSSEETSPRPTSSSPSPSKHSSAKSLIPRPTNQMEYVHSPLSQRRATSASGGQSRAKHTMVSFQIEIIRLAKEKEYGLHFKRLSGGPWNYKRVSQYLLRQMNL